MKAVLILVAVFLCLPGAARAQSIDALWAEAVAPPAPELRAVAADPGTTALLVLDMEELTCNAGRRPRCLDTVPRIADLYTEQAAVQLLLTGPGTRRAITLTRSDLVSIH